MKKIMPYLLLGLFSFLPIKSQQVTVIDENSLSTKGNRLELKINDYSDLSNSQGFLRTNIFNFQPYFLRNGLLNYSTGFQEKHIFFNYSSQRIKKENRNGFVITSLLDEGLVSDIGFYFPFKKISFGFERAISKKNLNYKTINLAGDTTSLKKQGPLNQDTDMFKIGNDSFYIKYINNHLFAETKIISNGQLIAKSRIKSKKSDIIVSLNPIKNINLTYADHLSTYLSTNTFPINITGFIDFENIQNNQLIIETNNLINHKNKRLEKIIENKYRNVSRVYDLNYEKDLRFLKDGFFNTSFSLKLQDRKSPLAAINFKYNDIVISAETKNKFNIAYMKNNFIIGFKDKQFYVGYKK